MHFQIQPICLWYTQNNDLGVLDAMQTAHAIHMYMEEVPVLM